MSLPIASKNYKNKIDKMVVDLKAILEDIETINDFGWDGRKYAAIAATSLEKIKYYLRNKDPIHGGLLSEAVNNKIDAKFEHIYNELDEIRVLIDS